MAATIPTVHNDPSAQVIPGVGLFSEWLVKVGGFVATCVESSELVLLNLYKGTPLTAQQDTALAQDLINRGQASAPHNWGATNWLAASQQLGRLGIPNTPYGPNYFAHQNWQATLDTAVSQGKPVLFGLSNARALLDDFTGRHYDVGVSGHAITIVGRDATGYLAVDPNMDPSTQTFVHYTAANLAAAGASSMDIPEFAPPSGVSSGGGGGTWAGSIGNILTGAPTSFDQGIGQAGSAAAEGTIQWALRGLGFSSPSNFVSRVWLIFAGVLLIIVALVLAATHQTSQEITMVKRNAGQIAQIGAAVAK